MAKQNINVGTSANDKTGDSLRQAFIRVNENFTELYEAVGLADTGQDTALTFVGSTIGTDDSSSIVIDRATTITSNLSVGGNIVPQTANGGDLGSSTLPWRSLYVSNNTIYIGGTAVGVDSQGNLLVGGQSIADVGTAAWNSITGKPTFATVATTGAYADLTGKPTFATVATSGAYTDLTGRPTLFSGSYNDLTNKPDLASTYQFSVAADDSTQRVISTDEVIKFTGAGGITTASDAEGNITITGPSLTGLATETYVTTRGYITGLSYNDLTDKPNLAGTYTFNVAADDSTMREISSEETVKFIGAGGITTASDAEGNITINYVQGDIRSEGNINIDINLSDSTLRRWQFGEDGSLTLPSVGKISNGAYDWTFGSTGITTFPGVIKAGNINNLVVNDLGGGTSQTAGSQVQIGNSAGIAGAGVIIKNAVTNTLGGESLLEQGSKIQMDNGIVSLSSYTVNVLGGGEGLENQLVVEVDNNYLNNVVRIGTRSITTTEELTTNVFQGITINQYGNITFPDATVQTTAWTGIANALRSEGNINIEINLSDSTKRIWQFGEDGLLTFPDGTSQSTAGGGGGSTLVNGAYTVSLGSDGKLTAPGNLQVNGGKIILNTGGNAYVESVDYGVNSADSAVNIFGGPYQKIKLRAGFGTQATWTFDTTGTLTLPTGGVIADSASYIKLTPAGGANAYQALLIYPTAGDGNHIHLAAPSGGTTELYLGNDIHYVKLVNGGNVEVRANNGVNDAAWQFGTDGTLTIPGDIKSNGNINIDINLADSTLRRWQFGEDGILTFPDGTNQSTAWTGTISWNSLSDKNNSLTSEQIALGYNAGSVSQGNHGVAIGTDAGKTSQGTQAVAIGNGSGFTGQGAGTTAIGTGAGRTNQGAGAVAIGGGAADAGQGANAVAVGAASGQGNQGIKAVAIGYTAGQINQGADAVAIGNTAGTSGQGAYSIAIGTNAGQISQHANSIILSATGNVLNSGGTSRFYVDPIRNAVGNDGFLQYNATTKEITYSSAITISDIRSEGNINIDINLADSTLRRWQFGEDGNLETPGGVQVAGILKINDGVHEQFQAKVDATGVVTHDCSSGHIFRHTSPDANWTANFTNLNLDSTYATSVTLIIEQGATGYYPSAVQIGGAAQTINWQGNVNPTVSTNRTDVVTFSIINNAGTYTVLGQLTGF